MSAKTLHVDPMKQLNNMKYGCYPALLDTWGRWIAVAVHLKEPHKQKLLISKTSGQVHITAKDGRTQIGHIDFKHRWEKNPGYFFTFNASEMCTI